MATKRTSILAATDFSIEGNRAVERAALLAAHGGLAAIDVLHVIESPRLGISRVSAEARAAARRTLRHVAESVSRRTGVRIEPRIRTGRPLHAIAEASRRFDLLVVGASRDHALRDLLIGSTAERLISRAPAWVLVVRRAPTGLYRRALVALEFSGFDRPLVAAARALAPHARLELMHVFDTRPEAKMRYAGVDPDAVAEYRFAKEEEATRKMRDVAEGMNGDFRTVVVEGHPASSLLRGGRESNAELIVVGHPRKSWLSNLLVRRTAAEIVPDAHTDTLVVSS